MHRSTQGPPQESPGHFERKAQQQVDAFHAFWAGLPRAAGQLMPHLRSLLDHADPKLQPHVAIIDVVPPNVMAVRLFATARAASYGQDITGTNALDSYPDHLKEPVFTRAGLIVQQPCGWVTQRIVSSTRGTTVAFLSISLPLAADSGARPCLVNFSSIMGRLDGDDLAASVKGVAGGSWIDLGAGIPSISAEIHIDQ